MPASLSLSGLCWPTPDGTPLFTHLDLTLGPGRAGLVGRNGTGKTTLLRLIAGELPATAGRIRIAGSAAMMRQEAMTHPDKTIADLFGAVDALDLLDRAEAGLPGYDGAVLAVSHDDAFLRALAPDRIIRMRE